jgi:hypothetical protein
VSPLTVVVTDFMLPTLSSLVVSTTPSGRSMVLVLVVRSRSVKSYYALDDNCWRICNAVRVFWDRYTSDGHRLRFHKYCPHPQPLSQGEPEPAVLAG